MRRSEPRPLRRALRLGFEAGVIVVSALVGLQLLYDGVFWLQTLVSPAHTGPANIMPELGIFFLLVIAIFLIMICRQSATLATRWQERVFLGALTGAVGGAGPGVAGFGALIVAVILRAAPSGILLLVPLLLLLAGAAYGGIVGGLTGVLMPLFRRRSAPLQDQFTPPQYASRSRRTL